MLFSDVQFPSAVNEHPLSENWGVQIVCFQLLLCKPYPEADFNFPPRFLREPKALDPVVVRVEDVQTSF
jgi:hypothetical protein